MKKNRDIFVGCMCALGCEVIFGFSYVFTKQATASVGALALLGWRFFAAAFFIGICCIAGLVKICLKEKKLKPLFAVALFNPAIYFIGETVGISSTSASESGAFLACIPVVSLIASSVILHKRPRKIQAIGIAVTLSGVIVTALAAGMSASFSLLGYVMLTVAVAAYALYSVFVEKAEPHTCEIAEGKDKTAGGKGKSGRYTEKATSYTGAEITFVMLMAGAAVFGPLAIANAGISGTLGELIGMPFTDMGFLAAILYQGVGCSVFAFFLSNAAISKIGVNRSASFIGVSTAVSVASGTLFLNEQFSAVQMAGVILIIAGVYTANARL